MSEAGEGAPQPERRKLSEKASPQQAAELFSTISSLTSLKGKTLGDRETFGDKVETVPASVAQHFPKPEPDSESVQNSFYVTHMLHRDRGVIGTVTFSEKERRGATLKYATHVNYDIISDAGQAKRLERHVTTKEVGPHMVRRAQRHRDKSSRQHLSEALELKARVEAARPIEEATGLLTVNSQEADEIINFFKEKIAIDERADPNVTPLS